MVITYYCISLEEALRRAKAAGKKPGCYFGGITLPGGRRGFAIYRDGKETERYTVLRGRTPPRNDYCPHILLPSVEG